MSILNHLCQQIYIEFFLLANYSQSCLFLIHLNQQSTVKHVYTVSTLSTDYRQNSYIESLLSLNCISIYIGYMLFKITNIYTGNILVLIVYVTYYLLHGLIP
jgi:hypothetical protein